MLKNSDKNKYYKIIDNFLIRTLNPRVYYGIIRYYYGKNLSNFFLEEDIKVIQWYENQTYERIFNKAFKENKPLAKIYGCRFFLYPTELFNIPIDKEEDKENLPDLVYVNGKFYIEEYEIFKVGPSLRYRKLFDTPIFSNKTGKILILFSYFSDVNFIIINFINKLNLNIEILIKFHPTNKIDEYLTLLSYKVKVTHESIYNLFPFVSLVIGAGSGSLVEAIACGIPVLNIKDKKVTTYSYLPEFSKGILWDNVLSKEDYQMKVNNLLNHIIEGSKSRIQMIQKVRNELFCKPTEEKIIEVFELKDVVTTI